MRAAWVVCAVLAGTPTAFADARLDRVLAQQACEARDPRCDWLATLSSLERASVSRGLARRGYQIEPSPWGKVIARVHVYNEEVFAEGTRLLRFFNHFHVTTQEYAIRHELVIGEGEVWDQDRVQETSRRLRDPLYSSVVAVVPVTSTEPGKVDMLVVTRDVWSLRLNTQYQILRAQAGDETRTKLVSLQLALSENNFLGTRSVVAAAVSMDQGTIAAGPLFIDKNLFGKKVEVRARVDAVLNREDFLGTCQEGELSCSGGGRWNREGSQSTIAVSKPLFALASKWGVGASFSHRFAINRQFDGFDLDTYDFADTPDDDLIPRHYRVKRWSAGASAVRQLGGKRLKHTITVAHNVTNQSVDTIGGFPSEDARRAFIDDVLPRSELTSILSASYGLFTPRYRTLRNIGTYELAEDVRYGPDFDLSYGVGLKLLGSDNNFQLVSASLGWTFPWCRDGFVRPSAGISLRFQELPGTDRKTIDNSASGTIRVVSPTYWYARVVAQATVSTRWNDSQNSFYTQGADDGLRGYAINEFRGTANSAQRFVRGNLEIRSVPRALWVLRFGGVLFYDAGSVADTFDEMRLYHDVGIGLRMLVPQTSRELFRFDLAFPLRDGVPGGTKRFTPVFIAGFQQAF